jgi:CRISPR/Cas system-associated exonuclease Cas4 (RecB family)
VPLPPTFVFSQASLQDYTDCPRRFQLRYLLGVRWPTASEYSLAKWEQKAQQGAAFHRLVHQHAVGIPEETLTRTIDSEDVRRWWSSYLQMPPLGVPSKDAPGAVRRSEVRLTTPVAGYRLMARYDLLALTPGQRAIIVDWKTNERRPERARLEERWQTRVYRYVLVRAGTQLGDRLSWSPAQVELIYWFANYPAQPERFPYTTEQYIEDGGAIETTIREIASRAEQEWTLTEGLQECRYCAYRTLCDREPAETEASEWELEADERDPENVALSLDIDLEQIAEIEF